jgi:hypothetical protein
MRAVLAVAAVLLVSAAAPSYSDYGAALTTYSRSAAVLAEAEGNGPSPGGRDTALYAEGEGNHVSPGGRDTAEYV